ncbi:hypothetical protein Leryth_012542 [Lithospermum erythrorhizon]|nr:hypothetical protein Leryth_012542 [Lithospermum erythrorhizon]
MEEGFQFLYSFKPFAITFILLLFLAIVFSFLWWRPRKIEQHFSKQGIRGPPYKFFVGNAKELVSLMLKATSQPIFPFSHNILPRVLSFYHHWKKIYEVSHESIKDGHQTWSSSSSFGFQEFTTEYFFFILGATFCSLFTLKTLNFIMKKKPPPSNSLKVMACSASVVKQVYPSQIITPTFHLENLKMMIPMAAKGVIEKLENILSKSKTESLDDGVEIEVSEWFQTLTEDIVTRTAFGRSYEDGKAIFRLQAQQMVLASEAFQKIFIPGYRFIPTKRNMMSWKLDKEIKKSLVKVIDERRQNWADELLEDGPKDLLGLMIQASIKESAKKQTSQFNHSNTTKINIPSPKPSKIITVHDIAEECKTFFFAGEQTTSNLLTWTTVLLAMHPEWQDQAREEVLKVCGPRDVPSKDDLPKLKMLSTLKSIFSFSSLSHSSKLSIF